MKKILIAFFGIFLVATLGVAGYLYFLVDSSPLPLYLTWQRDPTTSMTISWMPNSPAIASPYVFYRAKNSDIWHKADGTTTPFPNTFQSLNQVELLNLTPDTRYEFLLSGTKESYEFETLPASLTKPLHFVEGGDICEEFEFMDCTNDQAASLNPSFAVFGGDLAYDHGRSGRAGRWRKFFQSINSHLRAPDGRLIPIIVSIGNHEVNLQGDDRRPENLPTDKLTRRSLGPSFFAAFPFPGDPTYGVLDIGDYLSLVLLDSDHLTPVAGAQTEWLSKILKERENRPNVIPIYHVPAYPAHEKFDNYTSTDIRKHWIPLFDSAGLHLAFEHHGHLFKVTHPLRNNQINPEGITYLGDGGWGTSPRHPRPTNETWYIAKAESTRNFHEIILDPSRRTIISYSDTGRELNRLVQPTR